MIDLHNHLLPGIDDGAKQLEETLEFLRIARRDGITAVTATPHMKPGVYDNTRTAIFESIAKVKEAARGDEAEKIELLPGAEVYFTADVVERAKAGELMTVADRGKYMLLELPYQQLPMKVDDTIFQLRLLGITPIMAHPERVAYYLEDFERVAASVRLGALTQVTGNSITGLFGSKARDFAVRMLERNLIHILASDSHDVRYRPPTLSDARNAVAKLAGAATAHRLVEDNPAAILAGQEIASDPEPQAPPARRGLLSRLFRRS
ncbi:MAG TPA: CpsB/CapC family capsule biosynthesis tyrosine phosphatase [Candidatus Polarisedimenticolia bacterium]|jgi:protein-tyrosine phosphatase|nr:CpsB/CapC family capsule biosynthesis tyrosine phosphatase [Candidatus Polarisedimenticolia bacterium]